MKYIKAYEIEKYSDYELPKEGDYILVHIYDINKDYMNFINNTIGKVAHIELDENKIASILVLYDNIPQNIRNRFMYDEDEYLSKNLQSKFLSLHKFNFGYIVSKEKYFTFGDSPEEIYAKISAKIYNL